MAGPTPAEADSTRAADRTLRILSTGSAHERCGEGCEGKAWAWSRPGDDGLRLCEPGACREMIDVHLGRALLMERKAPPAQCVGVRTKISVQG